MPLGAMDILGIYVQNGLERRGRSSWTRRGMLAEIEEGNTSVSGLLRRPLRWIRLRNPFSLALGMSKKLRRVAHMIAPHQLVPTNEYFQARELGFEPDKPRRPMTKWFADIVARLSTRKPQRWTEAAVMLMRLSYEDQQEVFRRFEKVRRSLEKDAAGTDDEIDTVVVTPPAWRSTGFACVAFREGHRGDRHAIMERGASSVFQSSNAKRCLVIANDVKGATYPYATLGVFERPANAAI